MTTIHMSDGAVNGVVSDNRIRLESASQLTRERIRALIHQGVVIPGEKLSLIKLSEQFGVSKTPIRDALRDLTVQGLINIVPRVGVYVRLISPEEVIEVYDVKVALEPMMAQRAAERGSVEQKARFRADISALSEAADADDVDTYVAHLEKRRALLLEMAESDALRSLLAVIDGRVRLLRYRNLSRPGHLRVSVRQHTAIADAIGEGDAQKSFDTMQFHMRDARGRVRSLLQQNELGLDGEGFRTHEYQAMVRAQGRLKFADGQDQRTDD